MHRRHLLEVEHLPRLERFERGQGPQGGFGQNQSLFTGNGQGLDFSGIARGFQALGAAFKQRVEEDSKRRGIESNLDAELALTQSLKESQEGFDFRTQDFADHTLNTVKDTYQPYIDGAKTASEKAYLEQRMKQAQVSKYAQAASIQSIQFGKAVNTDAEQFVDKATKHIIANPDRENLATQIDDYDEYINSFTRLKDQSKKDELSRYGSDKFTTAYIEGLIDTNPVAAEEELNDPDIQSYLDANSVKKLKNAVDMRRKEDDRYNFAVMQSGMDDYLVRLQLGGEEDATYEQEYLRLAKELRNPSAVEALEDGKKIAVAARPFQDILRSGGSIADLEAYVQTKNPENFIENADAADVKVYEGLQSILGTVKKSLGSDMRAFEMQTNRAVQAACKDGDSERCLLSLHEAYSKRGVPEFTQKYISPLQAEQVVAEFKGLPFDEIEGKLGSLQETYGTVELANGLTVYDKVMDQLIEAGLPSGIEYVASLSGKPGLNRMAEAVSYSKEELAQLKEQFPKDERDAAQSRISDKTKEFFSGIGVSGVESSRLRDTIFKHAMNLVNHGDVDNLDKAVDAAIDFSINDQYIVSKQPNGQGTLVIPREFGGARFNEELVKRNLKDFFLNRKDFRAQRGKPEQFQTLQAPIDGFNQQLITSRFGPRKHVKAGASTNHQGIDIAGRQGDPVKSSQGGIVTVIENNGNAGNTVIVDHGNGMKTRYLHLHNFNVKTGDKVTAGQVVGGMGATGNVTGTHLHYEVLQKTNTGWHAVDPTGFIGKSKSNVSFGGGPEGLPDGYQEDEIWNTVQHLGKLQLSPDGSGYFVTVPRKENSLSGVSSTTRQTVWSYETGAPMFIPLQDLAKEMSPIGRALRKAETIGPYTKPTPEVGPRPGFSYAKIGRPLR